MRRLWRAALARLQARCHARPASGVAGRAPGPQGTLDSTSVAFVCARVVRHACKRPKHRCCQPRCSIRCDPVRARACAGARHDGAGGVDDVAAGLAAGVHQVDRRQQQLPLQMRAAPDIVLGLAGLRARGAWAWAQTSGQQLPLQVRAAAWPCPYTCLPACLHRIARCSSHYNNSSMERWLLLYGHPSVLTPSPSPHHRPALGVALTRSSPPAAAPAPACMQALLGGGRRAAPRRAP